jgi:hypothetical protein
MFTAWYELDLWVKHYFLSLNCELLQTEHDKSSKLWDCDRQILHKRCVSRDKISWKSDNDNGKSVPYDQENGKHEALSFVWRCGDVKILRIRMVTVVHFSRSNKEREEKFIENSYLNGSYIKISKGFCYWI